jgi:hypothetical protein
MQWKRSSTLGFPSFNIQFQQSKVKNLNNLLPSLKFKSTTPQRNLK